LAYAVVLDERDRNGRNWSKERLSAKLEEGSNILKQVYRCVLSMLTVGSRVQLTEARDSELPSYDQIIPPLLEHGVMNLNEHCKLTPGVPLKPMLAKPTKAIGEVLDRFEGKQFTCEYKYDGERAQVHRLQDGTVAVFSRNSEDMTKKYPELAERLSEVRAHSPKPGSLLTYLLVYQRRHRLICLRRRGRGY
jgi:DNA ligase 1